MAPRPEVEESKAGGAQGWGVEVGDVEARRAVDVLIVSLGSTGGLRAADEELLASLRRSGASAGMVRAQPPRAVRTLMLTDLLWARAARRAAAAELERTHARALIYSSITAALLWPRPGAIRFDAPAAANRPGRHGLWQRPLEARRLREALLLLPLSEGGLHEALPATHAGHALVLPVPVESPSEADSPSYAGTVGDGGLSDGGDATSGTALPKNVGTVDPHTPVRDIAAITYAAHPAKKGFDRILRAWMQIRKDDEELVVVGVSEGELSKLGYALPAEGVRVVSMLPQRDYRALLRRARVFVCAARREDYGSAQLEALADGCVLVTTPSPGPYAALPIARALDSRLVSEDLASALRTALDDPAPDYSGRALRALAPFRRVAVDRIVAEELLPRLLA
jgi:glycosyltransferase involved in cell wall biosynthesis